MSRIIFHVDMDSFFASVEQRENPSLKGKPVVVGALPKGGKGRGVVSTASYEARKYGIHSGMPISKAYRLNPKCIFLPVNSDLYHKVSEKIMRILLKYAEKFEQVSVDEAYLEVRANNYSDAEKLAKEIKREIFEKEKLTCSIGIGPNKLISKIASDFHKPDGLTTVQPHEVIDFLKELPIRKIPGIGPKTEEIFKKKGIFTIGDLQKIKKDVLISLFGKWGESLYQLSRGIDDDEVAEKDEIKSISRETTFEVDINNLSLIRRNLYQLCKEVHALLRERNLNFRTITLKIRFTGYETHTASHTTIDGINSLDEMCTLADKLLRKFLPLKRKLRLLGIRASNFIKRKGIQMLLFK